MARGEICKPLPDELVERIVSMVPFPSIFKFRCLSKSWLARLSSIPDEEDDAKKHIATTFQRLVGERSTHWKTFCPVFMSVKGAIIPYDQAAQNWQKMSLLSFLPKIIRKSYVLHMDEALLLMCDEQPCVYDSDVYVANILTRTWRPLPPSQPPSPSTVSYYMIHCSKLVLIDKSLGTYNVILLCEDNGDGFYFVQIYDSRSDSWTSNTFCDEDSFTVSEGMGFVYFNGLVYIVGGYDPPKLWAFNLEDGNAQELELSFNNDLPNGSCNLEDGFARGLDGFRRELVLSFFNGYYFLVVCNADLLMVIGKKSHFQVLKIDLESLSLMRLAYGPLHTHDSLSRHWAVSEGNCIFFSVADSDDRFLKYDTENNTWSWLPFPTSTCEDWQYLGSFQPGLSPFAAI